MDWMAGQSDMIAAAAFLILQNVPEKGMERNYLYQLMGNKINRTTCDQVILNLMKMEALTASSVPLLPMLLRGQRYYTVRGQLTTWSKTAISTSLRAL